MKKLIDNVEDMSDDLQWGTISNLENFDFYLSEKI